MHIFCIVHLITFFFYLEFHLKHEYSEILHYYYLLFTILSILLLNFQKMYTFSSCSCCRDLFLPTFLKNDIYCCNFVWFEGVSCHRLSVQVPGQRLSHLQRTGSQDITRSPLLFSTCFLSVRNPWMHSDFAVPSNGETCPWVSFQTTKSSCAAERVVFTRWLPQLIWAKILKGFPFWQSMSWHEGQFRTLL